ncbi:MAG: hypothetical protein AAF570_28020, partial [Bacteroidota bacterium]
KIDAMIPKADTETRHFFTTTISNFYFALKEHLREGVDVDDLDLDGMPYANRIKEVKHVPNLLVGYIQKRLNQMLKDGVIDGDQFRVLNR